jgi:SecD/SecF fusion protein
MKSFFWKFVICLTPVLLAGWITALATVGYINGEARGFKLGPDLAGGTILVYEIDFRKHLQDSKDKAADISKDTALLAESLKRRIDPNDLYNIIIRPAGGEGRVEIVLPTGGVHRAEKAQETWNELVGQMKKKYPDLVEYKVRLEVPRGKIQELAERIHQGLAEKTWEKKLLGTKEAWKKLLDNALDEQWPELDAKVVRPKLDKLAVGDIQPLVTQLQRELGGSTTERAVEAWVKQQAWRALQARALERWPDLKPHKEAMERISQDSNEQLATFIQTKGSVIGQAMLATLEPLLGRDVLRVGNESKDFVDQETASKFIQDNYGPSLQAITDQIADIYRASGLARDLTVEEVQRIKDLVAKVGSLEFKILANNVDDKAAIDDAKQLINVTAGTDPGLFQEMKDLQEKGLPPPPPRKPGQKEAQEYELSLPRNNKSKVTYSWVELGPQERRQLGLDNAARNDTGRNSVWLQAKTERYKATQLKDLSGRQTLQGALFYSRECKDRNLPEEERRAKDIEYFVLARNPEIDPETNQSTEAITGKYLVSAYADRQNVTAAVAFSFNSKGAELFGNLTRKNVPSGSGSEESQVRRHLSIILDGLVMSAPTINSEIRDRGQITGSFTAKEVDSLVNILRSGALPASLKSQPVSESTMGATLGADTVQAGVTAVGLAFAAVIVFMIFYYRFAGLVASIALLFNLVLTVGFLVAVQATFTLPGLAGLVLMLGMAVDANVLIYERLREERERGASLGLAIRNGYSRSLPTIIDTHLSSIFTCIVLYIVGNDQLKGFAVSLTAGLIISLFTSLYVTRVMFDYWLSRNWLHKLRMMRLFARPDIDFMRIRYYWFTATIILTVLGIGLFAARAPFNIDFIGGTAFGGQLVKPVTINEMRGLLAEERQKELLKVQAKELVKVKATEETDEGVQYSLVYVNPDGTKTEPRTITFANAVAGATPQERVKKVEERASILPDPSVEMIFPSRQTDAPPNHSRYFNVRSSEREPELIQAALDRLLSEKQGNERKPLLNKLYMHVEPVGDRGTRLWFYSQNPPAKFDPVANEDLLIKERETKQAERTAFQAVDASPSFVKTLFTRELFAQFGVKETKDLPFRYDVAGEGESNEGRSTILRLSFSPPLTKQQLAKVRAALASTETEFEARPQPDRLENFDSALAAETRGRALAAIIASWGAILLYLWFRFGNWTFGLAAVLCLVHDLCFTLGIIAAAHYLHGTWLGDLLLIEDFKLDLPAVAALLTLVGYSVNDTIVVFDRIREVRGKNPELTPATINDSVNQTLSRTLLASLTTWLVVIVLYIWGGPGVHLFAFVMVVGVIVGTYSSIYIASPLLLLFGEGVTATSGRPERRPVPQPTGAPA